MDKYKATEYFTDLQDNSYAYKAGDVYPRKGYTPDEARIKELSGKNNLRKRPVIAAVVEESTTVEVPSEEPVEKPKRRRKKREE